MSPPIRHAFLLILLLLIFGASLGVAEVIVRRNNSAVARPAPTLVWRLEYPGNFKPLDLSRVLLPIKPSDAMVEVLPGHGQRYLYIFRAQTSDSLADSSEELFEQFNHMPPTARAQVQMAGQSATELSAITPAGFVVQRATLIDNSLFAVTFVGASELTARDIATFNQICDSVSVRRAKKAK